MYNAAKNTDSKVFAVCSISVPCPSPCSSAAVVRLKAVHHCYKSARMPPGTRCEGVSEPSLPSVVHKGSMAACGR